MDFRLTPEQETFRTEVRAWLSANLPPDWAERPVVSDVPRAELYEFGRHWQRRLHEAGLLGLTWPKEFGGRGLTFMEEMILHEEMVLPGRRRRSTSSASAWPGPTIIAYGTDEQKQRYPPKMLSCEEIWCQGYSEPNAGSDLASLQTRAVKDGDHYVVNGQKVWTVARAHRRLDDAARPHRSRASRSTRASPTSCSTCTVAGRHRQARSARSPATPSSTRCTSTTSGCPRRTSWAGSRQGLGGGDHDPHVRAAGARVRAPGAVARSPLGATRRSGAPDVARGPARREGSGAAPEARAAVDRHRGVQVHGARAITKLLQRRDAGLRGLRRAR